MATNGGSGGCTTTAEASRKVYRDANMRARLVEMCPEPYRAVYSEILSTSESLPEDPICTTDIPILRQPAAPPDLL
jgi:hypothetical protein